MTDESEPDKNSSEDREWFVGPAQASFWKFQVARFVLWAVRLSWFASYLHRIPVVKAAATKAGVWAFSVTFMSRDIEEIEVVSEDEINESSMGSETGEESRTK